jgi:hypothetical protein
MPKDLGTWGFILSVLALILMYPVGLLVNWTSPKFQDWLAAWSQRRLQKKIWGLEREVSNPITGEEVVIYGLNGILHFLLNLLAFLVVWFTPGNFHLPRVLSSESINSPSSLNEAALLAWLRIFVWALTLLTGSWYYVNLSTKNLHLKYPRLYQGKLEKRIANLKAKLK